MRYQLESSASTTCWRPGSPDATAGRTGRRQCEESGSRRTSPEQSPARSAEGGARGHRRSGKAASRPDPRSGGRRSRSPRTICATRESSRPADGLVGQRQVRLGQFVNVGTQVIAVVPLPNIWAIANYKETQMTDIRIGQPATVTVDAFPDLKLTGQVDSWSPGTGSTSRCCRPTMRPGTSPKSSSACR